MLDMVTRRLKREAWVKERLAAGLDIPGRVCYNPIVTEEIV